MIQIDTTNFDLKKKIVLEKWGEILKLEMIDRCPKEYGDMVASIETEVNGDSVSVGTNNILYASDVEYGTPLMIAAHGEHIPENPVTTWQALRDRKEEGSGQTMPFARTASFLTEFPRMEILKEAFR